MASRKPVIIDHDGGVDDIIALIILAAGNHRDAAGGAAQPAATAIDLIGVVVIDADCFAEDAAAVSQRVLAVAELAGVAPHADAPATVPIAISSLQKTSRIAFPDEWRKDCINMLDLPCLHTPAVDAQLERTRAVRVEAKGEEEMARLVMASAAPVTLVVTGPLSNVAWCLRAHGAAFADNVAEVVIMGGALRTKGNVFRDERDGTAEWNIFWDARSAEAVLTAPLLAGKVVLFTLDSTNSVIVSHSVVRAFAKNDSAQAAPSMLSQFTGSSWAMCTHLERLYGKENAYYAWDALTAAYVVDPSVCTTAEVRVGVNAEPGHASEGRTFVDGESGDVAGAPTAVVVAAVKVDVEKFDALVMRCCRLV
jgi:purine nucleosidase